MFQQQLLLLFFSKTVYDNLNWVCFFEATTPRPCFVSPNQPNPWRSPPPSSPAHPPYSSETPPPPYPSHLPLPFPSPVAVAHPPIFSPSEPPPLHRWRLQPWTWRRSPSQLRSPHRRSLSASATASTSTVWRRAIRLSSGASASPTTAAARRTPTGMCCFTAWWTLYSVRWVCPTSAKSSRIPTPSGRVLLLQFSRRKL